MSSENIWKKIGKAAVITGGVIAGVALIPISIGFGTAGIVGGSIAAAIQAGIGNVAAGSLFAVCTSLGMTGVFASSAAVGAILGTGGLLAYINGVFSASKDAELIHEVIEKRDKPDIIINLLEARFPNQREETRQNYNEKYEGHNFDDDILNYIPINYRAHVSNILRITNEIVIQTENVRRFLRNRPLLDYFQDNFIAQQDALLIQKVIENDDNPLIIIRLLNYRNEAQRKDIDLKFREINEDQEKKLISYIVEFIPNHPDTPYVHKLLE